MEKTKVTLKYGTCIVLIALGIVVLLEGYMNQNPTIIANASEYQLYSWIVSGVAEIVMGLMMLLNGVRWIAVALGLIAILNLITYDLTLAVNLDIWVTVFAVITILSMFIKFIIVGRRV